MKVVKDPAKGSDHMKDEALEVKATFDSHGKCDVVCVCNLCTPTYGNDYLPGISSEYEGQVGAFLESRN